MAFHVLLQVLEPRGIHFRKSQSSYDGGHFRKGNDYLYLKIEEPLVDKQVTGERRTAHYALKALDQVPCGKLMFTYKTERYGSSKPRIWTEGEKAPLEIVLADMAAFICEYFLAAQKRRQAEAIERDRQRIESERRHQEYLREEAIRQKKAAEERHTKAIESVARQREDDLAKAAEWWRLHQSFSGFISECERRWLAASEGELTAEQKAWLTWARETASALSPFDQGYPDPLVDGRFDPAQIPFGGPYPATRKFPQPPTMPEIPAPIVAKQGYDSGSYQPPPKEPFPFWLKYPRR
jgi:hypothetical protein